MERIESLDTKQLDILSRNDIQEKTALFNHRFESKLFPENGVYGEQIINKGNGLLVKTTKTPEGHYHKEYFQDNKIFKIRETLSNRNTLTIDFDDLGNPYMETITTHGESIPKSVSRVLRPNTVVTKNNFTALTDSCGRPVYNKITDIEHTTSRNPGGSKFRNTSYLDGDQGGHLIPHQFGGPDSLENIVPQNGTKVNQGKMARIENMIKDQLDAGHKVDYEIKTNYADSSLRPSSFEPQITVDGEVLDLPDDLKKIYNDPDLSAMKKAVTDVKENLGTAHKEGLHSGFVAAGITFAASTVDNVSAFLDGDITAEEMIIDIVTETATAGVIEYGSELISQSVSAAMSRSSVKIISTVAKIGLPAAAVSFAVESYDSISAYAKGDIDGSELAYELGDNAASIAGAMKGGAIGATVGSVAGPIGTAAGAFVGSLVGAAVASEIYATAVEIGAEGVEMLAEKAESLAQDTVELFEEHLPDKLDDIKNAFTEFFNTNNLPFSL